MAKLYMQKDNPSDGQTATSAEIFNIMLGLCRQYDVRDILSALKEVARGEFEDEGFDTEWRLKSGRLSEELYQLIERMDRLEISHG